MLPIPHLLHFAMIITPTCRAISWRLQANMLCSAFCCSVRLQRKSNMSVLNKLASALDRSDEVPNQILAQEIAASDDKKAVRELINNLDNKSKAIQHDCIKVLYEIGGIKPELIGDYAKVFVNLLGS